MQSMAGPLFWDCEFLERLRLDDPHFNSHHQLGDGLRSKAFFGRPINDLNLGIYMSMDLQWQHCRTWALILLIDASRRHNHIARLVVDVMGDSDMDFLNGDKDPLSTKLCMSALGDHTCPMDVCAKLPSLELKTHPIQCRTWDALRSIVSHANQIQELSVNFEASPHDNCQETWPDFRDGCFRELPSQR